MDTSTADLSSTTRRLLAVAWPSFLVAALAELLFFGLFDPQDLLLHGAAIDWPRQAVYTAGLFVFWGLTALSSGLTVLLLPQDPS